MWIRHSSHSRAPLAALLVLAALPALAQAPGYKWEAEELAATAKISGGGDLVLVRSPDPAKFPFSGGAALTFVPRGKGATVEYTVKVDKPGVYTVRLRGVLGPSCGIYNILVNGEERGSCNWYNPATVYSGLNPATAWGIASKLCEFSEGENRIGFVFQGAQGRQGDLVLDTIELLPDNPQPVTHSYDEYDKALPAGEKLGPNLVQNPGFEEFTETDKFTGQYQNLRGWIPNSAIPKKTPIIVREAAEAHSGKLCVVLAPDPLEANVVLYQSLPVESGHKYRVSFWAKGDSALNVSWYYRSPGPDAVHASMNLPVAGEWQFYTYLFDPGLAAKVSGLPIAFQSLDRYRKVYLDDVAVQEVLP
jgi:hypothetical protein